MSASAEPGRPWEPDRTLTVEGAQAAIGAQFPQVETRGLARLGSGWEFDVYGTTDGWVFRFPRRSKYADLFDREARILRLVSLALREWIALPRVELKGEPCDVFPYAFAGHRKVPGVSADLAGRATWDAVAADIGVALSQLHGVPEADARRAGLEADHDGCVEWLAEARRVSPGLRGLSATVDAGVQWVETVAEAPRAYEGPLRVIHNDLKPEHLLVDPTLGRLTGIIDWTDAALADPALDFVAFIPWRGAPFLDAVLAAYELPLDTAFRDRVDFLSRVLSLVWLHECIEQGLRQEQGLDCSKHVAGVERAFPRVD